MNSVEEIKSILAGLKEELKKKFKVKEIGILLERQYFFFIKGESNFMF